MNDIIEFLRELNEHNERSWFAANKSRYEQAKKQFESLTQKLIMSISQFDPTVSNLTARDCTFRIYRDIRFSNDIRPYKTHMGAYICRGGKKSGYSGYYFHVGTGLADGYPHAHMLAIGDYICEPQVLKTLREDICYGDGDFDAAVKSASPLLRLETTSQLKRVPKGFPADSPWEAYLRLRNFCLYYEPDNRFMLESDMVERTTEIFKSGKPMIDYVNRAIEYVKDESRS